MPVAPKEQRPTHRQQDPMSSRIRKSKLSRKKMGELFTELRTVLRTIVDDTSDSIAKMSRSELLELVINVCSAEGGSTTALGVHDTWRYGNNAFPFDRSVRPFSNFSNDKLSYSKLVCDLAPPGTIFNSFPTSHEHCSTDFGISFPQWQGGHFYHDLSDLSRYENATVQETEEPAMTEDQNLDRGGEKPLQCEAFGGVATCALSTLERIGPEVVQEAEEFKERPDFEKPQRYVEAEKDLPFFDELILENEVPIYEDGDSETNCNTLQ